MGKITIAIRRKNRTGSRVQAKSDRESHMLHRIYIQYIDPMLVLQKRCLSKLGHTPMDRNLRQHPKISKLCSQV
eukprot:s3138_g6.t1